MKFAKSLFVAVAVLMLPVLAFAQVNPDDIPAPPVTSLSGLLGYICDALRWVFALLLIAAVAIVLFAAFKYLTAGGDPAKVKEANSMLIYAAVAVGVALLARAIVPVVGSFVGGSATGAAAQC